MNIKPILFNTDMTRAILAGRKTATRRLVKKFSDTKGITIEKTPCGEFYVEGRGFPTDFRLHPPYDPGDLLWVREAWATTPNGQDYLYKADSDSDGAFIRDRYGKLHSPRWRPSIHMPKEAARIFLSVESVHVDRLWDSFGKHGAVALSIEEEGIHLPEECIDCVDRYGCPCCSDLDESLPYDEQTGEDSNGGSECGMLDEVRQVFAEIWDSTIKAPKREIYGSDADPWVWIVRFERCEKPKEWME